MADLQIDYSWMQEGSDIWIELLDDNKLEKAFIKGKLIKINKESNEIMYNSFENTYSDENYTISAKMIHPINKQNSEGYDDMVNMENLNEAELLFNIQKRFTSNKIFTYVGPTLLVVNPYQQIRELFNEKILKKFQKEACFDQFNLQNFQPHIYAIAAQTFRQLIDNNKKQAIVISGESGAGKTEETKLAMKFLGTMGNLDEFDNTNANKRLSVSRRRSSSLIPNLQSRGIEEKILSCNPILEAFGNAKTSRNDNSSRFGKLVLLLVDRNSSRIQGAIITQYLLEKSRVINQATGERNFHVFYHLLKGASDSLLKFLNLQKDMVKYEILKKSNCYAVPSINDIELFEELEQSFHVMKFSDEEQSSIWQVLAIILHLGNLNFDDKSLDNENPCSIETEELFQNIVNLLKCQPEELRDVLLFKTRKIGEQIIKSPNTKQDAITIKDGLSKALYEKTFNWLVKKLNQTICLDKNKNLNLTQILNDPQRYSISLLDIFGFEVFKNNTFEQLCINYANEKIQQLYIQYVFKAEIQVFMQEGLKDFLFELNFVDNQQVIDLLELFPMGIFNLIDEGSSINTDDEKVLANVVKQHKNNKFLKIPKMSKTNFIILHSAKEVEYNINGFRQKNKDEISDSLESLMRNLANKQIKLFFKEQLEPNEESDQVQDNSKKSKGKFDKFLGAKFRFQMKELMNELNTSDCLFVRCIKPNDQKQKGLFQPKLVLQQLRYLGVLESIKIRKTSYPSRKIYE